MLQMWVYQIARSFRLGLHRHRETFHPSRLFLKFPFWYRRVPLLSRQYCQFLWKVCLLFNCDRTLRMGAITGFFLRKYARCSQQILLVKTEVLTTKQESVGRSNRFGLLDRPKIMGYKPPPFRGTFGSEFLRRGSCINVVLFVQNCYKMVLC